MKIIILCVVIVDWFLIPLINAFYLCKRAWKEFCISGEYDINMNIIDKITSVLYLFFHACIFVYKKDVVDVVDVFKLMTRDENTLKRYRDLWFTKRNN